MRTAKQKEQLPFGDLVMASYMVWGSGLAAKMVRWAIKTRLVVFRQEPNFLGSSMKGRSV
jgi:hypothetical protein